VLATPHDLLLPLPFFISQPRARTGPRVTPPRRSNYLTIERASNHRAVSADPVNVRASARRRSLKAEVTLVAACALRLANRHAMGRLPASSAGLRAVGSARAEATAVSIC
jgi:hypothetical protein